MTKSIFVLPLFIVFAYCSSSKKAAAPATLGISNVNVTRNDSVISTANASSSVSTTDRDWAYTANRDTNLNGTWVLAGMTGTDGNWTLAQTDNTDSSAITTDTALVVTNDTITTDATASATADWGVGNMGKGGNGTKNNRKALYDSAQARLQMDYNATSSLDTAAKPFQYWGRIPSVTLNATN